MDNKYAEINTLKHAAERLVKIGGLIAILGGIFAFLGSLFGESMAFVPILGFVVLFAGLIISGIGSSRFRAVSLRFKNEFLIGIIKEVLPNCTFNPEQGLSLADIDATEFLKHPDRFHTEDMLTGQLEEVSFISSDVRLEERHVQHTKNGTRVYYVTYFLGRVFEFTFNKPFDGYLQVLESGSPRVNRGFKKVDLESVDFNKKFRTYSTNELSAFYVLTPDIMERIMTLEKTHPGRIGFSFIGDRLFIAINNNQDTFDLKMFRKLDDSIIEESRKDLHVIKDIIMTLKLNTRIFKSN